MPHRIIQRTAEDSGAVQQKQLRQRPEEMQHRIPHRTAGIQIHVHKGSHKGKGIVRINPAQSAPGILPCPRIFSGIKAGNQKESGQHEKQHHDFVAGNDRKTGAKGSVAHRNGSSKV